VKIVCIKISPSRIVTIIGHRERQEKRLVRVSMDVFRIYVVSNAALNSRQIYNYVLGARNNSNNLPELVRRFLSQPIRWTGPVIEVVRPSYQAWIIRPPAEYRPNQTFPLCGNLLLFGPLLSVE
jgi:hypothetical protein